jgi:hypothetical protein
VSRQAQWTGALPWKTATAPVAARLHQELDRFLAWMHEMNAWGFQVSKSCVELNRELIELRDRVKLLEGQTHSHK